MTPPILASSTYRFATVADLADANAGRARADAFYSRYGNVNATSVESRVAALEGTEAALLFASGMGAIAAVGLTFLGPGQRLLALRELYGGTVALFNEIFARWGAEIAWIGLDDRAAWEREAARGARLVYIETPTNPLCRIADVDWFSRLAKKAGALLVCDATFATPVNQATCQLGADLALHSATKFLGGHSDLLGGIVAGPRALVREVERVRRRVGAVADPEQAWRLERHLKTLDMRVKRQNESALTVAAHLEGRPEVERVHYPGLPSHRDHELARRQMRGFGGILTFDLEGGERAATAFAEALELVSLAPSLGGVETLISPPMHTSHAAFDPAERRALGIADGALRLSIGIEDVREILEDLDKGFRALA